MGGGKQQHNNNNNLKNWLRHFFLNPTALRKVKIVCNFGLSECNRVTELTSVYKAYVTLSREANRKSQLLFPFVKNGGEKLRYTHAP